MYQHKNDGLWEQYTKNTFWLVLCYNLYGMKKFVILILLMTFVFVSCASASPPGRPVPHIRVHVVDDLPPRPHGGPPANPMPPRPEPPRAPGPRR